MAESLRSGIVRLAFAAALVAAVAAAPGAISPASAAHACPAADGTATVALIDGSTTTLDAATVAQIQAALGQATDAAAIDALAAIIGGSGFSTAAVLAAANCLGGDTKVITKAAAKADPDDLEQALKLLAYEPGVDPDDIVTALNEIGETELAALLSEFFVASGPQQPRPTDEDRTRLSESFENQNLVSPREP